MVDIRCGHCRSEHSHWKLEYWCWGKNVKIIKPTVLLGVVSRRKLLNGLVGLGSGVCFWVAIILSLEYTPWFSLLLIPSIPYILVLFLISYRGLRGWNIYTGEKF